MESYSSSTSGSRFNLLIGPFMRDKLFAKLLGRGLWLMTPKSKKTHTLLCIFPLINAWVVCRAILLLVPTSKLLGVLTVDGWLLFPPWGLLQFRVTQTRVVSTLTILTLIFTTTLQSWVRWPLLMQLKHLPNLKNSFLRSAMFFTFLQSSSEWFRRQNVHLLSSPLLVNKALKV